jgi:hypothetical protein
MLRKVRLKKINKKQIKFIGLVLLLLALPLILFTIYQIQNTTSRAALPDQLETESGVLSSSGVTTQADSAASGGQYVRFAKSSSGPTPTSQPTNGYGPRTAPSTPTGSNVYTVPSSIDGSGNTNVSSALQSYINSVPNGTNNTPSIILFPAGKTYQLNPGIILYDRNYLTFWGYGNTFRLVGAGDDSNSSGFKMHRSDNIKIFGFRIIGNDPDITYLGPQYQMGVAMYDDSDYVEVADTHISNVYGDGIFILVFDKPACNNWNFHHNLLENLGRQGITPNEGNGRIEWNIIRGTGMYSIDAEDQTTNYAVSSDGSNKDLGPILIANNWFDGWEWFDSYTPHSIIMDYDTTGDHAINNIHDITIENNLFTGGDMGNRSQYWGNSNGIISFWGNAPKKNINIRNNTFDLPSDQRTGWAVRLNYLNGGTVTGNVIPGMTVECRNCTNVNISNNN